LFDALNILNLNSLLVENFVSLQVEGRFFLLLLELRFRISHKI